MNNNIQDTNQDFKSNGMSSQTSLKMTKSIKDGHEYTHIQHPLSWQATRFIQALALTIFTLGIGLCFSFVREKWIQAFSGKEITINKIPEEQNQILKDPITDDAGKKQKENDDSSQSIKPELMNHHLKPLLDPSLESDLSTQDHSEEPQSDSSKLESGAAESALPLVPEESPIKKMIESGIIKESEEANAILKDHLGEKWFTLHHIDAFENLTELDLSNTSFPIPKVLIQTILKKCKKIKVIKGFVHKKLGESSSVIFEGEEFKTSSELAYFLLKDKNLNQLMQIPDPESLWPLTPSVLGMFVSFISEKKGVNNLDDIVKKIAQNASEAYLHIFISQLLNKENNPKLLLALFKLNSPEINKSIFESSENLYSIMTAIKSFSPLNTESFTDKDSKIHVISPRTKGLCHFLTQMTEYFTLQTACEYCIPLFEDETEESIKKIIHYFENASTVKNQTQTNLILLHFATEKFDEESKDEIYDFLNIKKLIKGEAIVKTIAKNCSTEDITELFPEMIKYYSGTSTGLHFINNFLTKILEVNDPDKITATFSEFWKAIPHFSIEGDKYPLLTNTHLYWPGELVTLDRFKLVIATIPDNLDESLQEGIKNILINSIKLCGELEIEEVKKVVNGFIDKKMP